MASAKSEGNPHDPNATSLKLLPFRIWSVAFSPPMRRRYSSCSFASLGFAIVFLPGDLFQDASIESVFGSDLV
jgi:hypothetical protein